MSRSEDNIGKTSFGRLAQQYCAKRLPLQVLQSAAGYYIGTADEDGPVSRKSTQYFRKREQAQSALDSGDWSQKTTP